MDEQAVADHAESRAGSDEDENTVSLLACRGEGPDLERLGFCALFRLNEDAGRAEAGVWFDPGTQGQGFATEAMELLVTHVFTERRLHRLDAGAIATDDRSRALLERLGFTEEGRRRDCYFVDGEYVDRVEYGLLATEGNGEWRTRARPDSDHCPPGSSTRSSTQSMARWTSSESVPVTFTRPGVPWRAG
jgi:RimJ/RimL family protein N-acetyltransferase